MSKQAWVADLEGFRFLCEAGSWTWTKVHLTPKSMLLALSVLCPLGVCPLHSGPAPIVYSSYVWRISHIISPTLKGRNQKFTFSTSFAARLLTCDVGSTDQIYPHENSICRIVGNRQCTESMLPGRMQWRCQPWEVAVAGGPVGVLTSRQQ